MKPNETSSLRDASGLDRREFLRLSGTLAAAGALASAGCQPPQEQTIPYHDMPDFVYYDHSAHLLAKNEKGERKILRADAQGKPIQHCRECHGKVETMSIVSVQNAFNIQWCHDCHRKTDMKASTDCVTCHR